MRIAENKPPPWSFSKKLRYSLHKQRRGYNSKYQTRCQSSPACICPESATRSQHIECDRKSRCQDPIPASPRRSVNPRISDECAQKKSKINPAASMAHGQGISQNPEHSSRGLMTDAGEAEINADRRDMEMMRRQDWRSEDQQTHHAPDCCHSGSRGN